MTHVVLGPYRFTGTDVLKTFSNLGPWSHHLVGGLPEDIWLDSARKWLTALARHAGDSAHAGDHVGEGLARAGRLLCERFASEPNSAAAQSALGSLWQGVFDLTCTLRARSAVPTSGKGVVAHVNTSRGGVPKRAIAGAAIDFSGVRGDRQGARTHHGRPWQALCLWSGEVIDELAAEGHPIAPGCAGENLTLRGIDWSLIRPGVRLRIGTALAEASAWAIPCRKNAVWFSDGDYRRLGHEHGPVSRIYATVIEPGEVATDDEVTLVP